MSEFIKKKLIVVVLLAAVGLLISLAVAIPLSLKSKNEYDLHARVFLEKYPLVDGHNDWSHVLRMNFDNQLSKYDLNDLTKYSLKSEDNWTHTDVNRLKESKLSVQFWVIYSQCNTQGKDSVRVNFEQIDTMKRVFSKFPNVFHHAKNLNDIREGLKIGKIVSLFGLEGGHAIDSSLGLLRIYHELGVRYMTLTHNCNTPWADNSLVDRNETAQRHDGLNDFGKLVIEEMNRLGMIVDLSHVSYKTMLDALSLSKTPVIFSHSNVYQLCNHTRNVRDDVLYKLKENGGVIMLSFYTKFVTCKNEATIQDVIDHINYVKDLIGVDHIGIGADYDGVRYLPNELEDVSKYPNLFAALMKNGWREDELMKLAGRNILRVLEENEKFAAAVKEKPPCDDLINEKYIKDAGFQNCRTKMV